MNLASGSGRLDPGDARTDTQIITPAKKKPRVQSAARAIGILQVVGQRGGNGIRAKDLSEILGLPRQVVYHLVHTLISVDMLRKVGGSSYALGLGLAPLAQAFKRQLGGSELVAGYAERAAAATGETTYVVGWLDGEIVVLATARGTSVIGAAEVAQGTAGDAHARASGKMLLAMAPPDERGRYLAAHPITQRTANTVLSVADLNEELAESRERGYSVDREEYALGLCCMAVPIGATPSQLTLGLSAPTDRFNDNESRYAGILREIAVSGAEC